MLIIACVNLDQKQMIEHDAIEVKEDSIQKYIESTPGKDTSIMPFPKNRYLFFNIDSTYAIEIDNREGSLYGYTIYSLSGNKYYEFNENIPFIGAGEFTKPKWKGNKYIIDNIGTTKNGFYSMSITIDGKYEIKFIKDIVEDIVDEVSIDEQIIKNEPPKYFYYYTQNGNITNFYYKIINEEKKGIGCSGSKYELSFSILDTNKSYVISGDLLNNIDLSYTVEGGLYWANSKRVVSGSIVGKKIDENIIHINIDIKLLMTSEQQDKDWEDIIIVNSEFIRK